MRLIHPHLSVQLGRPILGFLPAPQPFTPFLALAFTWQAPSGCTAGEELGLLWKATQVSPNFRRHGSWPSVGCCLAT